MTFRSPYLESIFLLLKNDQSATKQHMPGKKFSTTKKCSIVESRTIHVCVLVFFFNPNPNPHLSLSLPTGAAAVGVTLPAEAQARYVRFKDVQLLTKTFL